MKLLIPLMLLAGAAQAAQPSSTGTIRFVGALVEPTCRTELVEPPSHERKAAVRLHDCRSASAAPDAGAAALPADRGMRHAELSQVALSEVAAYLVGRDRVDTLTVSYQ